MHETFTVRKATEKDIALLQTMIKGLAAAARCIVH